MRALLAAIVVILVLVAGGAWFVAGRAAGPTIIIVSPGAVLGQSGTLDVKVGTPGGALQKLDILFEQNGQQQAVFTLPGGEGSTLSQEGEDQVRVTAPIGRQTLRDVKPGKARILVAASRPVFFGLRTASSAAAKDIEVRLQPPRVSVASIHHFVNHGGSELVVYRATPPDVESGVRVGDRAFPGFPASGAGIQNADPSLRVAFFALTWDQDLNTPISLYARDAAGNEAKATFDYRVFPKPFRKSTIDLPDSFLDKVVPEILEHTPDLKVADPNNHLESFLTINGELRRTNAETIAELAKKSAPTILWHGPFTQLTNSQVESSFADQRSYVYQGKEVDKQVHLGFDLAVTTNVSVKPANDGVVLWADYLGIYGNCVIVDHGMGLQSLYAHLSSITVKPGDKVDRTTELGRSGMTGLAGGDHLHFTTLLNGVAVTPVDWWSKQWIEDRVMRKLREAGAPAETAQAGAPGGV